MEYKFIKEVYDKLGEEDFHKLIHIVKTSCPDDYVNNGQSCVGEDRNFTIDCAECWVENLKVRGE